MSAPGRRPIWFLMILGLCLLALPAACTREDDSLARVERRGRLLVGLDPTFPPFENADHGELEGIDVDLARALAAKLGVEAEFVYYGYDGLYDALLTEQVDVLISALVIDPARTRDFAYSEPYFNAGQFLVIRAADRPVVTGMADLSGRKAAVELGSEGHLQALAWQKKVTDLEIATLPTADDAMWLVRQEEVDAALADHTSARLYRRQFPDLALAAEPVTVEPYALVTRVRDRNLMKALGDALARMQEDGQLQELLSRWLDS